MLFFCYSELCLCQTELWHRAKYFSKENGPGIQGMYSMFHVLLRARKMRDWEVKWKKDFICVCLAGKSDDLYWRVIVSFLWLSWDNVALWLTLSNLTVLVLSWKFFFPYSLLPFAIQFSYSGWFCHCFTTRYTFSSCLKLYVKTESNMKIYLKFKQNLRISK